MQLTVLGSSSAGNCYLLENQSEVLIIECGVHSSEVKKAIDFKVSKVVGALVTHEHGDHAKYAWDIMKYGIDIYSTQGTAAALGITHSLRWNHVELHKVFKVGNFRVMAFPINHDAAEPCGFLINHNETGNILFITDTYFTDFTFSNLKHIIIEANYCQDILAKRLEAGTTIDFVRNRVVGSHMSLQTAKRMLAANDLTGVKNIVLVHLSDTNSDAKRFKKEVSQVTGKPVHIAETGMKINMTAQPF